jgi:hypothetical protein
MQSPYYCLCQGPKGKNKIPFVAFSILNRGNSCFARSASNSVQTGSSAYTIDYSPKSSFLREMQKSGQVVKIMPQRACKKFSPAQRRYSTPPFKRQCLKESPLEPTSKFFHASPHPGKCHCPKDDSRKVHKILKYF